MNNERIFGTRPTIATEGHLERGYQVGAVYKTDDLNIFKFSKFNRTVLLSSKMIEQAKEGLINPIIVNEDFIVIDGQHRLAAAKAVDVPIEYIVKPGLNENDIVRMNTVQKPWTLKNHIEAWANQGNEEYRLLAEIIKTHVADTTSVVEISLDALNPSKARNVVEKGQFKFNNKEITNEFFDLYRDFRKKADIPSRVKVVQSLYQLFRYEKVNMDRLLKKTISTGLNEEIKIGGLGKTNMLQEFLEAYNGHISTKNKNYINYHISPNGQVVIEEDLKYWAEKHLNK